MIKPKISHSSVGITYAQNLEDLLCKNLFDEYQDATESRFRTVVDIGASDGITLSNSRLFVELGFQALLIDGDEKRFAKAKENSQGFTNCTLVCEFVNSSNIQKLLTRANLINIGVLTIDVDGPDLSILKNLISYDPRVVVI